jgi:ABC-2 type transport system permease protein
MMQIVFALTLKASARDPYLVFWSLILPIGGIVGLSLISDSPAYNLGLLAGMTSISILFFTLMTTSYAVLAQRRRGVYHLLHVTPIALWKYVLSLSSAWTVTGLFCGVIILTIGSLVIDTQLTMTAFLLASAIMMIAGLGYVFLSFFIASLSQNEGHISIITNIITIPLILTSDAFYSLQNAPAWVTTLNRFNPFQWFLNGIQSSLTLNISQYVVSLALLLLVVLCALLLAVRTFRYSA